MNNSLDNTPRTVSTKRFWRKLQSPQSWKFRHWVLLLLWLLIPAYAWFAVAPAMEKQVADSVFNTLNHTPNATEQFDIVNVIPDGQTMLVQAIAEPDKELLIKSAAEQTVCRTWIGKELRCPTAISVELKNPPVIVDEVEQVETVIPVVETKTEMLDSAETVVAATEIIEPIKSSHDFAWIKSKSGLELIGDVPTDYVKGFLLSQAIDEYVIQDENLTVTNMAQAHDDAWAYTTAWEILRTIQTGRVEWLNGQLSVFGDAYLSDDTALKTLFVTPEYSDQFGELRVAVIPELDRCNQQFAQSLADSMIQFDIGSTRISTESDNLLSQLSVLAKSCDTRFIVEGHTDNSGSAKINRKLSQERAQAVVDSLIGKGVEATRLEAIGYGESKPIATNVTEIGRLENRRISITATN